MNAACQMWEQFYNTQFLVEFVLVLSQTESYSNFIVMVAFCRNEKIKRSTIGTGRHCTAMQHAKTASSFRILDFL